MLQGGTRIPLSQVLGLAASAEEGGGVRGGRGTARNAKQMRKLQVGTVVGQGGAQISRRDETRGNETREEERGGEERNKERKQKSSEVKECLGLGACCLAGEAWLQSSSE